MSHFLKPPENWVVRFQFLILWKVWKDLALASWKEVSTQSETYINMSSDDIHMWLIGVVNEFSLFVGHFAQYPLK